MENFEKMKPTSKNVTPDPTAQEGSLLTCSVFFCASIQMRVFMHLYKYMYSYRCIEMIMHILQCALLLLLCTES